MTLLSKENICISPAYLDSVSLDKTAQKIYNKLIVFYPDTKLLISFDKQGSYSVSCKLQITGTDFVSSHKAPSFQQALYYCGKRLLTQIKKQSKKQTEYKKAA